MHGPTQLFTVIALVSLPTVMYGGYALMGVMRDRKLTEHQRAMFRAGHAHAGVLLLLTLVGILYVDQTDLSGGARTLVRTGLALAPILMPAGFFFSVLRPSDDRPNRLIVLVYLGALSLAVSAVTLGLSLL